MTKNRISTAILTILVSAIVVLTLSSCSGLLGGYDGLEVRIDGASGARYIDSDANSGYIVLMKGNKVFSLSNLNGTIYEKFENGYARIPQIPAGDYILGVVLIDDNDTPDTTSDDTNVGLAIKEITIQKGYNSEIIDVGPGISYFYIDGVSFEDFMQPDGYEVGFEEDTIIIYSDSSGLVEFRFETDALPIQTDTGDDVSFTSTAQPAYSLRVIRRAP